MLIDHLHIIFGEMPIQIPPPIFKLGYLSFCFWVVSLIYLLSTQVFCPGHDLQNFLLFWGGLLAVSLASFEAQKFLILRCPTYWLFLVVAAPLVSYVRNQSLMPGRDEVPYAFFSGFFSFSSYLEGMMQFEFITLCGRRGGPNFLLLHMDNTIC